MSTTGRSLSSPPTNAAVHATGWLLDSARNRAVVDGLRAIGIILVIAFHGAFVFVKILPRQQLDNFIAGLPAVLNVVWQALGSEVVFFSSGFLLAYLLLREHARNGRIDMREFWIRRASRILPLFLLALFLYMIGRNLYWDRLLTNLLFVARVSGYFDLTPRGGKNFIPVGWSLEIMVHAYLALPFLVRFVLRTRWPLTAALLLAALSVVPRYLALVADPNASMLLPHEVMAVDEIPRVHRDLYYVTWFRMTPFMLGLAAAVAVTHHRSALEHWLAPPLRASATLLVGALLIAASGFLPLQASDGFVYELFGPRDWLWFWSGQRAVLTVGTGIVLITALVATRGLPALLGRFLALPIFAPISHGIYSIYLFHFAGLVPAALLVFSPAVIKGVAASPTWNRKDLEQHVSAAIDSASVWQYLLMVAIAVWLSTKFATFLTRTIEAPLRNRLRARRATASQRLQPPAAGAEQSRRA